MTEIADEFRRSILRKEFYMDVLNCDPMSFDKECELTNAHFHKNKKREDIKSHHYIISYDPAGRPSKYLFWTDSSPISPNFSLIPYWVIIGDYLCQNII